MGFDVDTLQEYEEWLPVVGFEGWYEVSSAGGVRSVDRVIQYSDGRMVQYIGRALKPSFDGSYRCIKLFKNSMWKSLKVHSMVARAFLGEPASGLIACHWNGDSLDNRLENLRWDTPQNNGLDAQRHGTLHNMRKTHCPSGHPYDSANTRVIPSRPTARYCRECNRIAKRNARLTKKESA